MEHTITLVSIAIGLFLSTNIDDIFVLLSFFSDRKFKFRQIVVGQFMGMGILYGISILASIISLAIAPAYVGLLGLVPIFMGFKKLWEMRKGVDTEDENIEDEKKASVGFGNVISVSLVTLANGADNISIYTPLFALRSGYDIAVIGVVFAIMTFIWIIAAHWLTNHRAIGIPIRRYGHLIVPFVLIALGVLILYESRAFELLHKL